MRNKRRTLLSGLAMGLGLAALIFADAISVDMSGAMVRTATSTFMGEAQIHGSGFRDTFEMERVVKRGAEILRRLPADPDVAEFAPRTVAFAMINSAANSSSVLMYGVDPSAEMRISKLAPAVRDGGFLSPARPDDVLIGSKLAKTLQVDVGEHVVLTVAQYGTGQLEQARMRVGGIFRFNSRRMDADMIFLGIGRTQELLALGENIHEIAVKFREETYAESADTPFKDRYAFSDNEILGWPELMPELAAVEKMSAFGIFITGLILFGVVSLGILNTLFMSLYERMFEFGVLRAMGTRPVLMASMILCEAGVLSLISIVIGALIGAAAISIFAAHGIDYTGVDFAGITFMEPIVPAHRLFQYTVYPAALFVFTLCVGLYPAVYAARLSPSKAMRRSL